MLKSRLVIGKRYYLWLLTLLLIGCGGGEAVRPDGGPVATSIGFISQPNLFVVAEEVYSYQSRVSDPGQGELVYELLNSPDGMTIDSSLGNIAWTPTTEQGGGHAVSIRATVNGATSEQSYRLEVGVPRIVLEKEIGPAGGELAAGDIVISIPPGAVDAPTTFSLWMLEEGIPPLWQEMNLLGLPFILRSSGNQKSLAAVISMQSTLPKSARGYLARPTQQARASQNASDVDVVVVNEASISADSISADLTAVSADFVDLTASWMAFTYLFAEVFDGDGFTLVWAYNELALDDVNSRASEILAAFADAKSIATGSMGCEVQEGQIVYVATFFSGSNTLGIAWDQKVFLNKQMVRDSSTAATRDTIAHEYFHTVQGHILGGAQEGWIAEPTAEFAAGQIFNVNLSHESFGALDGELTRLGFAPQTDAAIDLHKYKLYIYFRFLRENTSWRVCDFYESQKTLLLEGDGAYPAMAAELGVVDFPQSYLDFVEAYLFDRSNAAFGDDAAGIGDWEPDSIEFTSAEVTHEVSGLHGGTGITVKRVSSETQNISVALSGSFTEGVSLPMAVIRNQEKAELASLLGSDDTLVVLKKVSSPEFTVTVVQGLMEAHPTAGALTIKVVEFGIVVDNLSGIETDENGNSITFDVALSADPGNLSFVVDVTSSDLSEAQVDKASLTFTKDNWDAPQTITVTGRDDSTSDGDIDYTIDLSVSDPVDWDITEIVELVNLEPLPIVTFDINTTLRSFPSTRTKEVEGSYPENPSYTRDPLSNGTIHTTNTMPETTYTNTITDADWTAELISTFSSSSIGDQAYSGAAALPYSLNVTFNQSVALTTALKINDELVMGLTLPMNVSSLEKSASQPEWAGPYSSLSKLETSSQSTLTRVRAYGIGKTQVVRFYVRNTEVSDTHSLGADGQSFDQLKETTVTTYEEVRTADAAGNVVVTRENSESTTTNSNGNAMINYEYAMLTTDASISGLPGNHSQTTISTNTSSDSTLSLQIP